LQINRVLRNAINQAARWNMLARNPCDMTQPPSAAKHAMRALEVAEEGQLLGAARGRLIHVAVLFAISTGLRRAELLAMKWRDIGGNQLRVQRALEQVGKVVTFKAPKTKHSERSITLPEVALEALTKHRAQQAQHRLMLGKGYKDQGLVFTSVDGLPWSPDSFSGYWRRLIKRSKMERVRFHDLGHTHASQLLKARVHVKVVSERLGHATITLTLGTYSHLLEVTEATAAAAVDEALGSVLE
jgi:integrase